MDILLLALRLLLALLLYAFLGLVLWMLWRDLRQATVPREIFRPQGQLIVLPVMEETGSGNGAGSESPDHAREIDTVFPLRPVTSIGRSPANTISIPDSYASARHALLTWREGQWWLEDQESRNGTLLNGARIDGPTVVSAGDVIGVGRTEFKLETL